MCDRGGYYSECLIGYEGPLCQSCLNAKRLNFVSMDCGECDSDVIVGKFFKCGFFLLLMCLLIRYFFF